MTLIKRVLKSDSVRSVLCWLGSLYIRLLYHTSRWTFIDSNVPEQYWSQKRPFIFAFWHGRLLLMPYIWPNKHPITMLVSGHRDGRLISQTTKHLGISTAVGSSSSGGTTALRNLLSILKSGDCIGITPDGPRGPRMRASGGIIAAAKLSGCAIIPAAYSVKRARVLSSWDRFMIPQPFTAGTFIWGNPITVPKKANSQELEEYRQVLETELNKLSRQADEAMGRTPVEPDSAPTGTDGGNVS